VSTHVLVAATDADALDARMNQLRAPHVRVSVARTWFEAVVKATCHLPDLILLDASLGKIEIEETKRLLATCPVTAHIPVLSLSARRTLPRRILNGLAAASL
jgi:DNA-binding response OmpR family regulator